jgi:hypothetical protein
MIVKYQNFNIVQVKCGKILELDIVLNKHGTKSWKRSKLESLHHVKQNVTKYQNLEIV